MGAISSSLPSTSGSTSATTPVTVESSSNGSSGSSTTGSSGAGTSDTFTGTSSYSGDLQNIISREVQIAELPIQLLQNQQTFLTGQSNELTTMDGDFTSLQTAVQGLQTAMSGSSFQSEISAPSIVSATLSDGATEGVYSIDVQSIGAYASSMSTSSWVTPINTSGTPANYTMMVGTTPYTIKPTDDSAATVASTINSQYGNLVNATVVNVGSTTAPDYRVSLQSTSLGPMTLDLKDSSGNSLQTQQTTGVLAQYVVDNSGKTVTSASRSVTIASGVTLTLLAKDNGTPADVTVTRSTSALDSALSTFTTAYNAAVKEIAGQRGQNSGALQGQSILFQLQQTLAGIATYSSPGSQISGLRDLGLTLNDDGSITYDSSTLEAADIGDSSAVTAFMGSTTTGGFLQAATNALTNLEDPTTGLLKNAETDVQSQIANIGTQITAKQAQVNQLQTNLTSQMASADSMISMMQQQYSEISGMFQAMQTSEQMYANG